MHKKKKTVVALLVLVMSLGLTLPVGASAHTGFNVDCAGAFGLGSVPAGDTYTWIVRLSDGPPNYTVLQAASGSVTGPAAFDPVVPWNATPPAGSLWRITIDDASGQRVFFDEGELDCQPAIDIEKATNGFDADTPTGPNIPVGDPVIWTYVVTNTGNVDLTDVQVTDDQLGVICWIGPLAVGASATCTTTSTAMAGQYANVGTTTGDDPTGQQVTDSDPSHYFGEIPANPTIDIEKFTLVIPSSGGGGDLCDSFGKPQLLTMVYTGDNILAHSQDAGKVSVTGDPMFASPVQIIASEKSDGSGKIYTNDTLSLGQSFTIDATLAGDRELRSNTYVLVKDAGGNLLSTIKFHTSCSQPLELGNQFGSIQLVGFADKNGAGLP